MLSQEVILYHAQNSLDTQLGFGTPPIYRGAFQPSGLPTGLLLAFLEPGMLALTSPTPDLSQLGNKYNEFNLGQEMVACMELIPS